MINTLTEQDFPHFKGKHYADLTDNLDLLPKPKHRLPIVAIGRARQEMDWLANVPDAWIWHGVNPADTANIINTLADLRQKTPPQHLAMLNLWKFWTTKTPKHSYLTTFICVVVQKAWQTLGKRTRKRRETFGTQFKTHSASC